MSVPRLKLRAIGILIALMCAGLWPGCASTKPDGKAQKKGDQPLPQTASPDTARPAFEEKTVFTYPAVVVNRMVNLRKGPGTNYDVAAKLSGGQVVTVVASSGEWVKVLVDRDNLMGWIHKSLIRRKK